MITSQTIKNRVDYLLKNPEKVIIILGIVFVVYLIVKHEVKKAKLRKKLKEREELLEDLGKDYYSNLEDKFNSQEYADAIFNELTRGYVYSKYTGWICTQPITLGTNCVDDDRLADLFIKIPSKKHLDAVNKDYIMKYGYRIKGNIGSDIIHLAGQDYYMERIKPIIEQKR